MQYKNFKVVTFANEKYYESQNRLDEHLKKLGIGGIINYKDTDLPLEFYKEHENLFKYERGFGYWIWKPYIILNEIEKINDDEILVYIDCGDIPNQGFFDLLSEHFLTNDIYLNHTGWNHAQWTKRDCFIYMNCDTQEYHNSNQLEAGVQAYKKTNFNIQFIKDWYSFMKIEHILTDEPNIYGYPNLSSFIEHRHDQSILTNLCIQRKIKTHGLREINSNANQ